jgi:hypothetical protein
MKKQTPEEAAERLYPIKIESCMEGKIDVNSYERNLFIEGAKWQQEQAKQMEKEHKRYSEFEVRTAFAIGMDYYCEPNSWDKVSPIQKLENLLNKQQEQ